MTGRRSAARDAFDSLTPAKQRVALMVAEVLGEAPPRYGRAESDVHAALYRMVESGLAHSVTADTVRDHLTRAFTSTGADLDPVPAATVEQARKVARIRTTLLHEGAYTTSTLAEGRGMSAGAARQWISRARRRHRIFTVVHDNETMIPAFLLDETTLDPLPGAQAAIAALREAGDDGWSLWAWFATPSAWLGSRRPRDLIASDPERLSEAARQRAASSA